MATVYCNMCHDRQVSLFDDWMVCEICRPKIPKNPLRDIASKCKSIDEYTETIVSMIENKELLRPHAKCAIHTIGMVDEPEKKIVPPKKAGIDKYIEDGPDSDYSVQYLVAIPKLTEDERKKELQKQLKLLEDHIEYKKLAEGSISTIQERIKQLEKI